MLAQWGARWLAQPVQLQYGRQKVGPPKLLSYHLPLELEAEGSLDVA